MKKIEEGTSILFIEFGPLLIVRFSQWCMMCLSESLPLFLRYPPHRSSISDHPAMLCMSPSWSASEPLSPLMKHVAVPAWLPKSISERAKVVPLLPLKLNLLLSPFHRVPGSATLAFQGCSSPQERFERSAFRRMLFPKREFTRPFTSHAHC